MFKFRVSYKNKATFQEDWVYIHVEDKAQLVPEFYKKYPPAYFTLLNIQEVNGLNQSLMQPWEPTFPDDLPSHIRHMLQQKHETIEYKGRRFRTTYILTKIEEVTE